MDSPIPPDPYKTLGIDKSAPLATVRSAHRKLVLTCHPDKVTDESAKKAASDKFHLVQQAYEILSDETRRERYDERVKLAELRAQMMKEKGGSRIIPDIGIRGGPKRTHEMRDNTIYEYREPREPPPRSRAYEEEDYFQPRYQEVRPSKKYDDRSFAPTPRKTSARAAEDKRRARELEDERERKKEMSRAEEKARAERSRKRGMDRRKDYEYKNQSSRKFATVQDDDEDSTDSDSTETTFIRPRREDTPKKRYEDDRRREKEDIPRRSTKRDPYDDYDDKHSRAQDYITQSRSSVEPEPRRVASHNRSFSYVERPPPPPAAPIVPVVDTSARRSSARDSRRREPSLPRLSKKDRRVTEIVDPPPSSRKPSLPGSSSDPKGLKLPQSPINPRRDRDREPHRSATLEHTPEPRHPTIRRAETMPSNPRNAPAKPSKLKEQHDSGYSSRSSRGTPELSPAPSPQMTSTKYRYNEDSEDEVTIVAEPEETYRRHRDNSPPTSRRERPKMSSRESKLPGRDPTSTRATPTMRSGSYAVPADQMNPPRQPPFVRTESGRPPPLKSRPSTRGAAPLYGEVPEVLEPYEIVNHSPKYRPDDIRYTDYPRRGSADDRDAYAGSPRHRPEFSRSESRAVHV